MKIIIKIIVLLIFCKITFAQSELSNNTVQQDTLVEEIELFSIKGKAAYGNGITVFDAEVTLLDTNEKLLFTTRSSKKLFNRFGGGRFKFEDILPGEYIINVDLGTRIGIVKRIELKNKNLNVGTITNTVEFPKYEVGDYSDSTRIYLNSIPTDPIEPDSINVRHIMVDLDGGATNVIIDSVLRDSAFFTLSGELTRDSIPLDRTYIIFNDYGKILHQSSSMKHRIKEIQKRDGFIIFQNKDTLHFDNVFFEESYDSPQVATFHYNDTSYTTQYHSFFDIYKIKTGPSYVGNSVERAFKTGYIFYGSLLTWQLYKKRSFSVFTDYLPSFSNKSTKGKNYYSLISSFSFFTIGWITYDWYRDRRSNYFTPTMENDPFPQNMFIFSMNEWVKNKAKPYYTPILESKIYKFWKDRKKRKAEKEKKKRKSVFD